VSYNIFLYCELQYFSDGLNKFISINNGGSSNRVIIYVFSTNDEFIRGQVKVATVTTYSFTSAINATNDYAKIALKYKQNDFSLYINGTEVNTSSSGNVFSANTLNSVDFNIGDGGSPFYGKVKGLAVYNEALSESQLMQLTGVTASSIYSNFVTRTASFTVEALNEVKKVIDNL
jgi:hypothetical protein